MLTQDLSTDTNQVPTPVGQDEEVMIEDGRGALTPTQAVEQKLIRALHAGAAPVSLLQRIYRPGPR